MVRLECLELGAVRLDHALLGEQQKGSEALSCLVSLAESVVQLEEEQLTHANQRCIVQRGDTFTVT